MKIKIDKNCVGQWCVVGVRGTPRNKATMAELGFRWARGLDGVPGSFFTTDDSAAKRFQDLLTDYFSGASTK